MLNTWKNLSLFILTLSSFIFADVLMTELTDPQNSSDAGRYVELYNNGDSDVDLSLGWTVQRWTNANPDPTGSSIIELTGSISAGGFYIICNDADKFAATYGGVCDQNIGTGGFSDSNGDDNMAILLDGTIIDMFGVAGEDGSGTGHEFEDGRAERASGVISSNDTWDVNEWNIDNDSGGGDGNQYAPEGFDPGAWIGNVVEADYIIHAGTWYYDPSNIEVELGSTVQWINDGGTHDVNGITNSITDEPFNNPEEFYLPVNDGGDMGSVTFNVVGTYNYDCSVGFHAANGMVGSITVVGSSEISGCTDSDACNYDEDATDDDGSCYYPSGCDNVCDSNLEFDECGECGGDDSSCSVNVTFSVDMSIEGVVGDIKVRTSTVNGEYSPSDWYVMDDSDGDLVYTYTLSLLPGFEYGYNFNNSDGSGYESGDDLEGCAGGNYGNDRYVTPSDSDMTLDTICWESCDTCPEIIYGCTDPSAENYDPNATIDDGTCTYLEVEAENLFISEASEGSSNNKYIEIFNASNETVDLSEYAFPNVSNDPSSPGEHEYWNTFDEGATVYPGDVYVICHGSSDPLILDECDQYHTYLSNGDDGFCLVFGSEANFEILDCVGDWNGDPGSGWDVAGVPNATKDHTLVRKSSVLTGNTDWTASAGTNVDDSEWIVLDQNTWTYLGFHETSDDGGDEFCQTGDANLDNDLNVLDVVLTVEMILGGGSTPTEEQLCAADTNGDTAVNVLDVVLTVEMILGTRGIEADKAEIILNGSDVLFNSNGHIGAFQITLSHNNSFELELTDNALVSEYRTIGNITTIIIVSPETKYLFKATGHYIIEEVLAATTNGYIDINMPVVYSISSAYPNPFNPSTNIDIALNSDSKVNISIYNTMGQLMDVLINDNLNADSYSFTWNAENIPSGLYLIKTDINSNMNTQKVLLLK